MLSKMRVCQVRPLSSTIQEKLSAPAMRMSVSSWTTTPLIGHLGLLDRAADHGLIEDLADGHWMIVAQHGLDLC